MTLLARLRDTSDHYVTGWAQEAMREAADEIEWLRNVLEKITRLDPDDHGLTTAQFMARDALDNEQATRQKPENLGRCPIDGKECDCIMPSRPESLEGV